jgi:hypothetical protein
MLRAGPPPSGAQAAGTGHGRQPLLGIASLSLDPGLNHPGAPADNWGARALTGLAAWRGSLESVPDSQETLKCLASEGATAFGVPLEWARVSPRPGVVDEAALAGYSELLRMGCNNGLEPVVTLQFRTHPEWLGEEFWLTPGSPDLFRAHVATVASRLGDLCRHWVTVQSPGRLARGGWVTGELPPHRRAALADAYTVLDNLMAAQMLAEDAIRAARPDALVAAGHQASDSYDEGPLALDLMGAAAARATSSAELVGWLARRRAEFDRLHPAGRQGAGTQRLVASALSPFGTGWLRRPCPLRSFREVAAAPARPGPDAVMVVWDRTTAGAGLVEWCRLEAGRHGLPIWLVVAGSGVVPTRSELDTLREAELSGVRLGGWFRLAPGPLLLPEPRPGG